MGVGHQTFQPLVLSALDFHRGKGFPLSNRLEMGERIPPRLQPSTPSDRTQVHDPTDLVDVRGRAGECASKAGQASTSIKTLSNGRATVRITYSRRGRRYFAGFE